MSYKLYIGFAVGIVAGVGIAVILSSRKEEELFSFDDLSDDNYMLDTANKFLSRARLEAEGLISDAKVRSESLLQKAGDILSKAKEKTSEIHFELKETAEVEINKIKDEIDKSINDFKKLY